MIVYASKSTHNSGVKFTSDKPTPILTVDRVTGKINIVYSGTLICCLYGIELLFPILDILNGSFVKINIDENAIQKFNV